MLVASKPVKRAPCINQSLSLVILHGAACHGAGKRSRPQISQCSGSCCSQPGGLKLLGRIFRAAECSAQGAGVIRSHLRGQAATSISHSRVLAPPSCRLDPGPAPSLGKQEHLWCLHRATRDWGGSAESVRSPHPTCNTHPCHRPPERC